MIRVAVIDSFPLYRNGLGDEVEHQADMQLVWISKRGSEAVALCRENSPDVIILGVNPRRLKNLPKGSSTHLNQSLR